MRWAEPTLSLTGIFIISSAPPRYASTGLVLIFTTLIALGIIFFGFGFLKFFPNLSSVEDLAARTIEKITFQSFSKNTSIQILAIWECFIGIGLILGKFMFVTLALLFFQMLGTLMPIFMFPNDTFLKFH